MVLASILKTFAEVLASTWVNKKKKKKEKRKKGGEEVVFSGISSHTSQITICGSITIIQGK